MKSEIPIKDEKDLSLLRLTQGVLIKYLNTLTDVGQLPPHTLLPVLRRIHDPHQLRTLELNSPHLNPHTTALWQKLIQRDFGFDSATRFDLSHAVRYSAKHSPSSPAPTSWSAVYDLHVLKSAKDAEKAKEKLKQAFGSLKDQKGAVKTRLVSASSLPRNHAKTSSWGGSGGGGWGNSAANWDYKAGSKTKNIVERARKEVKEMRNFRTSKLAKPMKFGERMGVGGVGKEVREKERVRREALGLDKKETEREVVLRKVKEDEERRRKREEEVKRAKEEGREVEGEGAGKRKREVEAEPPKKIIRRRPTESNPLMRAPAPVRRR